MPDDDLLRLIALDAEDLAIVSAHVQDAVLKVGDITWLPAEKRLVVVMNRFAWEAAARRRRDYQRRRSALHFSRIEAVRATNIDQRAPAAALELLAVQFEPREPPSGDIVLVFAGGATMRLTAECIEAQLTDLGPAWSTPLAPRHVLV
jgi:hypothetical protein